jgi:hypothetical protein
MKKSLFVLLAALAAATLVCNQPTTPGDWSEFTEQTVKGSLDALAAADSVYQRVYAAQGADAAAESTRVFLLAHEAVAAARSPASTSVTAFFANGLVGSVFGFDRGLRDSLFAAPQPEKLPGFADGEAIASAVVLTPFAHDWGTVSEDKVIGFLDTCFGGPDSATEHFTDAAVNVDKVKEILQAGPGVLLWSSHGDLVFIDTINWDDWSVLLTGESYPSQQMAERIVRDHSGGARQTGADRELVVVSIKGRPYLAVTPKFVSTYGNFDYMEGMGHNATKSVVYACCCFSAYPNGKLVSAFGSCGVDAFLGWTDAVGVNFAAVKHYSFFKQAADTCTIHEAYNTLGNVVDPKTGAELNLYILDSMMIRSQLRMKKDGSDLRGYSVGVHEGSPTSIACFTGDDIRTIQYGVSVNIPGPQAGSYNCQTDEDAELLFTDLYAAKAYIAKKKYVGVNGTIDVQGYTADRVSGTFSGTLGYWTPGQNPEEDPPSETIELQNGFFKHMGLRQ